MAENRTTGRISAVLIGAVSLLLLLSMAPPAAAQVLSGSLTGYITDPSGAAIPGAKVEALNIGTGITQTESTNEAGVYLFTELQPGRYKVTISATHFGTVTEDGVIVNVNAVLRLNAELKVSQVTETITVSGAAELMQTDRSDVHADLATTAVTDLPIAGSVGRNFEALLKLVPGIQPPAEQNSVAGNPGRSMAFNVNGVSWVNNNVRLDGAPDIYGWLPYLMAYVPPEEAIQEVNVVTNSFLPEQGTAGGSAVNVIIRSGSNQLHGAAWEYNTNTDFNARSFFFNPSIILPKDILNQFGARVGGPIKRNKLFFFADWERTMQREFISGFGTLPTAAVAAGDFSGTTTTIYDPTTGNADGTGRTTFLAETGSNKIPSSMIDPVVAHYISLLPSPNLPGTSTNYFGAAEYGYNRDDADGKLDYQINQNNRIFYRYSILKGTVTDPFEFGAADGGTWDGGQPGAGFVTVTNMGAGGTHTFSPNMVIDGNVGYDRQHLGAAAPDVNTVFGTNGVPYIAGTNTGTDEGGIPYFNVQQGWSAFGNSNTGNPFVFRDNSYVGNVGFSWIHGTHSMRFGWDYTHFALNHFQPEGGTFQTARGSFRFTGGLTALSGGSAPNMYNTWADFLLGLPQEEGKVVQTVTPNALRWSTWAFYAQDQFQVSHKLTLTYGLRYEYYPFVTRDHTGPYVFQPSTGDVFIGCEGGVPCNAGESVGWGNIDPRLGVAYRLSDRTVLRAGAGINMDPDNWRDMRNTYPAYLQTDYVGANSYQAAGALTGENGFGGTTPTYTLPQGTIPIGLTPAVYPNITLGTIPLPPKLSTQAFENPFKRGYIESWNLTVERNLGSGFTGTVAYVGSHEVRQMSNVNIDASYPGGGTAGELLYPINTTGSINEDLPFASSMYDALQTQVMRRAGTAQVGVVYTYSHAMDFGDNSTYNGLIFAYPTYWGRDRASAGYNRSNNFQLWSVYELPFGKGHRLLQTGVASHILGGWEFNNIFSAASGTPFTVEASNTPLNAPGNTEVAEQTLWTVTKPKNVGPGQLWFNTSAFTTPASGTFGNVSRNDLVGPGFFEWDTGLFRNFNFLERYQLQFRAESIAVTNTPIFSNPGGTVGSSTFGQITSTAVSANGVNTGGGNRVIRLALKLSF